MITFQSGLRARKTEAPLLRTGQAVISAETLTRLVPTLDRNARLAVTVSDPATLLALLSAYDGRCEMLLLMAGNLDAGLAAALAAEAGATVMVSDRSDMISATAPACLFSERSEATDDASGGTEWLMTTSGTTGRPKMLRHTLDGLARTVKLRPSGAATAIWGLTYEPTRFAGMQVLLQAALGGGTLVAREPSTTLGERLATFVESGVTHLSATPTLWRQILMHPSSGALRLCQVTLGGEIADQGLLNALSRRFPEARLSHIYASTEVGVGFSVTDGREGFPAEWLRTPPVGIALKIRDGRLWIRVPGAGSEYVGSERLVRDKEGFVDTLDNVALGDDRVTFLGRDTGVVNVGGAKVYPEVVERTLNEFPQVAFSRVVSRKNPITGAILIAEVVPAERPANPGDFKAELLRHCRHRLPIEAVPALVKLSDVIPVNAAGKVRRS